MAGATAASAAPGAAAGSRLEVRGLQKRYGSRQVVKEVHLAVGAGEVVGLLGPNGAGKTTTFYMVVGLVRADAGEIRIDGTMVQTRPIHERARMGLSYLPQEASIFRKLTVAENLALRNFNVVCAATSCGSISATATSAITRLTGLESLVTRVSVTGMAASISIDAIRRSRSA